MQKENERWYVVGKLPLGKSWLFKRMIKQAKKDGVKVTVLDTKKDMINATKDK